MARFVADFWKVFYIENYRFALDTLRVANRSPTPTSKTNDFQGPFAVILGVRGRRSQPILGVPGVRAGLTNTFVLGLLNGHHVSVDRNFPVGAGLAPLLASTPGAHFEPRFVRHFRVPPK